MKSKITSSHNSRAKTKANRVLELVRDSIHSSTTLGKIRDQEDSDPFKILVSTIMSARTRDPVTDKAAERLFREYPDVKSMASAELEKIAEIIKPVSFYNQKAKHIIQTSNQILNEFHGEVPETYEKLLELPGVGRKTAGCVLVYGFGKPAIPVDLHMHRISNRIGLVKTALPEETETQLLKLYDQKYWIDLNELFVSFGKTICRPVGPKCEECSVRKYCGYYRENRSRAGV
ncbi:MAG: endonuclease III domain-containing protein [Nitrososphaerales archaeon]